MSSLLKREYFPMQKDFGKLLENFFRGQLDDSSFVDTGTWAPAVDIKEEKDRFLVVADIPGVKKEDMNISLENNILTLHGSRSFEKTEKRKTIRALNALRASFIAVLAYPKRLMTPKLAQNISMGY